MGIGALRRYHPTLDPKLAEEAGVEVGDRFNEEGNKSLDGVTSTAAEVGDDRSDVQDNPESITVPPSAADAEKLTGGELSAEQQEQIDGDAGKSNDDLTGDEQATLAATEQPEQPPRSGTGSGVEAWRAYALAHGYTEKDVDGLSRDDLADLFK